MGNRWDGVLLKYVGFGKGQERKQQYLTCTKIVGLVSKKSHRYKMSFVQLTMKRWFGLSWVEIADVQWLSRALKIRWEQEVEENTACVWNCWVLGSETEFGQRLLNISTTMATVWHKLGDGFNTSFDARSPCSTEHHCDRCFQRETVLSVRSPAFFSSRH